MVGVAQWPEALDGVACDRAWNRELTLDGGDEILPVGETMGRKAVGSRMDESEVVDSDRARIRVTNEHHGVHEGRGGSERIAHGVLEVLDRTRCRFEEIAVNPLSAAMEIEPRSSLVVSRSEDVTV